MNERLVDGFYSRNDHERGIETRQLLVSVIDPGISLTLSIALSN